MEMQHRDDVRQRSGGMCECRVKGCTNQATQFHHKKYKSRGGSDRPENIAHVCLNCHESIHRHRPGTEKFRTSSWEKEG